MDIVMYGQPPNWDLDRIQQGYPLVPAVVSTVLEENVTSLVGKLKTRLAVVESELAKVEALQREAEEIRKMLAAIGQDK